MKSVLSAAALAVLMSVPASADTVYPPGSKPLVLRSWCVHLTGMGFVANNSLGERKIGPLVGVGFSPLRWGALRLPVVQVQIGEADQSNERLLNKTAFLASAGISLRTGEWDNGRFEPQFHIAFTRDLVSKRNGVSFGGAIGF